MEYWRSLGLFLSGILKRYFVYVPPVLLDPFDIAERVFKVNWIIPQIIAISLFILGWIVAAILTYHELRMQHIALANNKSKQTTTTLSQPKKHIPASHSIALYGISETMTRIHGHDDIDGMRADVEDGVLVSDLLNRNCTLCGKPRNEQGDYV